MGFSQEAQEGLPVVLPELLELCGWRELAAGQLQGHLHAPVPDVVVVLNQQTVRIHAEIKLGPGIPFNKKKYI